MRRIGLFGGSFDPVHQGHLALARAALAALDLHELRWVPTGESWQKARPLTPAVHRVAMIELVMADEPRFVLERCELERGGPSYTLDTVRQLARAQAEHAEHDEAQWFLLIGQDQYANLHTWHEWRALLGEVTLAVAARAGQPPMAPALDGVPHSWVTLPMPPVPVSATDIRRRLAAGEPAATLAPALVAPAVAGYIARHALYGPPR